MSYEEWAFVGPYLTLCREDAPQREYFLRSVFNAVPWLVRSGAHWRMMPNGFPPWPVVYQQTQRWIRARCFAMMAEDLRCLLREFAGHNPQASAMVLDGRTLQSMPESGSRSGYDGAQRSKGSKVHAAVDTLGHLLALRVTAADEQDRAHVERLAEQAQQITGDTVELAYVDQEYTGERAQRRHSTASNWGPSSTTKPNAALCCCRDAGWWREASPGQRVSGGRPAIMNGFRKF